MRITSFLLLITLIATVSCKKKKDPQVLAREQFNFGVDSLQELPVKQGGTNTVSFFIKLIDGPSEDVSISLDNIPSGIHCTIQSPGIKPPFSVEITASAEDNVPIGAYPIKLTANSASGGLKQFSLDILVCDKNNCACDISGRYTQYDSTIYGISTMLTTLIPVPGDRGHLQIQNFANRDTADAYLDCSARTVVIPKHQTTSMYYAWGTGTFTDSSLYIHYYNTADTNQHFAVFKRL